MSKLQFYTTKNKILQYNYKSKKGEKMKKVKAAIKLNENTYGQEARQKYGDSAIDESNRKMLKMSDEEYLQFIKLSEDIKQLLVHCASNKLSLDDEQVKKLVSMHQAWLKHTMKNYQPNIHKEIALFYTQDERFNEYYQGYGKYLADAINYWL